MSDLGHTWCSSWLCMHIDKRHGTQPIPTRICPTEWSLVSFEACCAVMHASFTAKMTLKHRSVNFTSMPAVCALILHACIAKKCANKQYIYIYNMGYFRYIYCRSRDKMFNIHASHHTVSNHFVCMVMYGIPVGDAQWNLLPSLPGEALQTASINSRELIGKLWGSPECKHSLAFEYAIHRSWFSNTFNKTRWPLFG